MKNGVKLLIQVNRNLGHVVQIGVGRLKYNVNMMVSMTSLYIVNASYWITKLDSPILIHATHRDISSAQRCSTFDLNSGQMITPYGVRIASFTIRLVKIQIGREKIWKG